MLFCYILFIPTYIIKKPKANKEIFSCSNIMNGVFFFRLDCCPLQLVVTEIYLYVAK